MSLRDLSASARFFLRIGQTGKAAKQYDEYSGQLFPLTLIMDAEGLLAGDARHLVDERFIGMCPSCGESLHPGRGCHNDDAAYLAKCRAAIECVDLNLA